MKKTYYIFIFLICFLVQNTWAQKGVKESTVDVEGLVGDDDKPLAGAFIQVTQNGKDYTSFTTDLDGRYNLYLPLGAEFLITATKRGYVKKSFYIDTRAVPADKSDDKFATIEANLVLFKYYEGVDYSIFNQPINKYYYSIKRDNFEYDKDYLKQMMLAMAEVKKQEKNAIKLAAEKQKQDELLAKEKLKESENTKIKAEQEQIIKEREDAKKIMLAKLNEENEQAKKNKLTKEQNNFDENLKSNSFIKAEVNLVSSEDIKNNSNVKKPIASFNKDISYLMSKYKPGVTEEIFIGEGIQIVQRVVVQHNNAWVYEKKIFSWGGISYFRDRQSITQSTFENETEKM
ncbi:MAG: hypothetical protein JSU07_12895 [Bacteroidetes bacterium]|nr:hypothetical protein [Bacteroidota bacterium]